MDLGKDALPVDVGNLALGLLDGFLDLVEVRLDVLASDLLDLVKSRRDVLVLDVGRDVVEDLAQATVFLDFRVGDLGDGEDGAKASGVGSGGGLREVVSVRDGWAMR